MSIKRREHVRIEVTLQELDTIFASLRLWQQCTTARSSVMVPDDLLAIASFHGKPLPRTRIDELCERLNTTGIE